MKFIFSKNFMLLWQGQLVSKIGTFLFDITLVLWIKNYSNSAALISIILIAGNVPEILLAPFGGTLADNFSRKKIMVVTDFISGVLLVIMALLLFGQFFSNNVNLVLLVFLSILQGILNASFSPAVSALIPTLVCEEKLNSANSAFQATSKLSMVIGQGLGGLLYMTLGPALVFLVNGLSYVFSGFSEMFIKIDETHLEHPKSTDIYSKFRHALKEGIRYCWSHAELKYLLFVIGIYHFFVAPLPILLPFWVSDTLHLSEKWVGFLMGSFAAGVLTGFTFAGIFDFSKKNPRNLVTFLFLASSIVFLLFGIFDSIYVSLICLFSLGCIIGMVVVIHITFIQKLTDSTFHGRVFGLLNTLTNASVPVGLAVYGLLLEILNKTNGASPTKIIFIFNGFCILIIMSGLAYRKSLNTVLLKKETI